MIIKTTLDNGLEVVQNFEWHWTKRKICIFMPNYHDKKFTEYSVNHISTQLPKDDYIIIIGNDGHHVDFDHLKDKNAYYFTLNREDKSMRNGGFIRNYIIKRCQSELFFQKDGEVVVLGDFIKACVENDGNWRAGNIFVLNDKQTEDIMTNDRVQSFIDKSTYKIKKGFPPNTDAVKHEILNSDGKINLSTYFHYAYCVKMSALKDMNGYDEGFKYYGYEDSDMFCRLYDKGNKLVPDYSVSAVHLCHPRLTGDIGSTIKQMKSLFSSSNPSDEKRNPEGWGNGI